MPAYAVNDKVRLAPARGGWEGFVSEIFNAPGGGVYYRVASAAWGDPDEGATLAAEADVAAGPLTAPSYSIGDEVTLYGRPGVVDNLPEPGVVVITVEHVINRHLTVTNTHRVPLWRVAIENGG